MQLFYVSQLIISLFHSTVSKILDTYISKEIKDFESCPWVKGPTLNITHTEDYDSITICWRFLTTAYPHCAGESANMMVQRSYENPNLRGHTLLDYRVYQPISDMSEDGKQAGWLGFLLNETVAQSKQVHWRSILYNEPLKIDQWQSVCVSFSKKHRRKLMYHNGFKYLDTELKGDIENIVIQKGYLDGVIITEAFRGLFSDLQVYSTPMDDDALVRWTTCLYDKPGDVFEWDITRLNLTHDESIVSVFGKVDSSEFCLFKESSKKEVHLFGDRTVDPINQFKAQELCKRLNGKIMMLPITKEEMLQFGELIRSFQVKTNSTKVFAWVGGIKRNVKSEGSASPHWYPKEGIYDFIDPETGKSLINEENKMFLTPDYHTYQQQVDICSVCYFDDFWFKTNQARCQWQKCNRNIDGRVFCEFYAIPSIKIKGLCKTSLVDRDFQLIEPKLDEGMYSYHHYITQYKVVCIHIVECLSF